MTDAVAQHSTAPTREQITALEVSMRQAPEAEKIHMEPEHTFGPGFYCRTLRIPSGAKIVGKVHAKEHIFILSKGEMLVATEDGKQHVKAPFMLVARPGLKRVGWALTDCLGTNVHITDLTDLQALEAELIVPESLPAPEQAEQLEGAY